MTIYSFGTSFTYGVNADQPEGQIEHTYCDYLSKAIDIPVVNYGMQGAHNLEILDAVVEVINNKDYYRPIAFIIELRESASPVLVEKHKHWNDKDNCPIISNTRHDSRPNKFRATYDKYWRDDSSWQTRSTYNSDVKGYCNIHYKHNIMFDATGLQVLSTWHMVQNICKSYNIPTKLFAFASIDKIEENKNAHIYLDGLNTFGWKNLQKDIFTFITHLINDRGLDWVKDNMSSCGHYSEAVHEYLANTIKDEIKELIGN